MAFNLSLRTKGVLAVLVLIGYLVLIAVLLSNERKGLVAIIQEVDANQANIALLEPTIHTLARSLVESQSILNAQDDARFKPASFGDVDFQLEALNVALEEVRTTFPNVDDDVARFRQAVGAVKAMPTAEHLARVRDGEQVLLASLQGTMNALQKRSRDLALEYDSKQQFISVFAVSANVVGAVASVAVILVFFTRLARDIKRLQGRAAAIVAGYDGAPLSNTRRDEVGGLIDAVNRMQSDLRRAERQMELARQQRFHQEKMAAVGSLAAAISHEVNNPIAAISGVAQFIADETRQDERPQGKSINEFATQILKQTERVAHIMRQMSTLTAPRSPESELLDLNALVRSTYGFVRYDKRFRGVEFDEALEHDLPAVTAVADHVTQILVNLLLNAADATEHLAPPETRRIRITTRVVGDEIHLRVADNGRGMAPDVLARAFDESFTTKPAGKGRGIGLFVCKSLIEKGGGRIELESTPDVGTTATVRIPLHRTSGSED